jgi:ATP-dependent exoDNAse (exonuclease V) beta subunit
MTQVISPVSSPVRSLKRHRHTPRFRQGRQQFWIEQQPYVGVTSVLKVTRPPQHSLLAWQSKVGAAAATQAMQQGSERGQVLHELLRAELSGQAGTAPAVAELNSELKGYWQSLQPVLGEMGAAALLEGTVWHPYGFAGVVDALVVYQGELCVCDWKSGAKPKRFEWLQESCLQVAAYAAAINRVYQPEGVRVGRALLVVALPEGEAQVFALEPGELLDYWRQFQVRYAEYLQQQNGSALAF